jgi:hypothetical protein
MRFHIYYTGTVFLQNVICDLSDEIPGKIAFHRMSTDETFSPSGVPDGIQEITD